MAAKKNTKPTPSLFVMASIAEIIAAGVNGLLLEPSQVAQLVADGLVEVHPEANAEGKHLVRATQKGIDSMNATNTPAFTIADNVEIPAITGRGRASAATVYPFEHLAVGQSFFIPNDEKRPDAAKSMASTVSSANARYAEGTGVMVAIKLKVYAKDADGKIVKDAEGKRMLTGEVDSTREETRATRKFELRAVADGAKWGFTGVAGAGIWRTL